MRAFFKLKKALSTISERAVITQSSEKERSNRSTLLSLYVSRGQQIVLSTSLILLQTDFHRGATASTNQQTALRRKKKKSKRLDTSTSGIFVRRGVSSPRTIHCLEKD